MKKNKFIFIFIFLHYNPQQQDLINVKSPTIKPFIFVLTSKLEQINKVKK